MSAATSLMAVVQMFTSPQAHDLRTTTDASGAAWFVAQDVCRALGLNNTAKALARLDSGAKGSTVIHTLGGRQRVSTVNEAGLYALTMRSDKPEARAMQTWVTGVVLPTIRKHGGYVAGAETLSDTEQQRLYAEMRDKVNSALRLHDRKTQHDHWLRPDRRDAASLQAAHEVARETGLSLNVVSLAASHGVDVAIKVAA